MPVGESSRPYVVCPVCGHVFKSTYASTYITVGREADLCPKIPGRPSDGARLIRSAVTMCPVCSFAAGEAFDDLDLTFDERYGHMVTALRIKRAPSEGRPGILGQRSASLPTVM